MTRKFEIELTYRGTIEVAETVIDVVDDAWREELYNLKTPEEIICMVADNLLRGADLSGLDGWADQPDSNAHLSVNLVDDEIKEVKP